MREWFEAGGIEPVYDGEAATPDGRGRRLKASGAELACLCSDDATYAARAEAFAARGQGGRGEGPHARRASRRPRAALRAAGVDDFVFMGGDAVAGLKALYRRLAG